MRSGGRWNSVLKTSPMDLGCEGHRLSDIKDAVARVLDMVQMARTGTGLRQSFQRWPAQRVAVARAIAFSPTVVLSRGASVQSRRQAARRNARGVGELQRRLEFTSLYVTHDQEEALAISDRVIVMNGGKIEQIGSPEDIYNRPCSRFVADFVGSANMIEGRVTSVNADGSMVFETKAGSLIPRRRQARRHDAACCGHPMFICGRTRRTA